MVELAPSISGAASSRTHPGRQGGRGVCLKERRKVVLMLRDTPLHAGHIDLMAQATKNGAIIMPPVPAFYALPSPLDDVVNQTVARALELLDISIPGIKRWDGTAVVASESPGQVPSTAQRLDLD